LATGAITRAIAPVAAEIIARRPPTIEIVTAIVNEAKSPTCGSTPARIENEIASGISASATASAGEDLDAQPLGRAQRAHDARVLEREWIVERELRRVDRHGAPVRWGVRVGWGRPCKGTGTRQP
jgi:hypothetical protein